MIDFLLCPFRFLAECWDDGPGGQWLAIFFGLVYAVCAFVLYLIATLAYDDWLTRPIHGGLVIGKWYEPSHTILAGKVMVRVPDRFHVVIRGKDRYGRPSSRDFIVWPSEFNRINEGADWNFD